jgi:nucleotidyltransferase-like protein
MASAASAAAIPVAAAPRATGDLFMDKVLTQLVEKLKKAFGDRLVSVVLYGSAASGDHHPKFSDFNILCVLSTITPRELADGEEIFRWWREQGSPSPLLLTEGEVTNSTDCFAIEFLDIKQQHQLLHGKDVVSALAVDRSFYRAQVEHDLRAKLLRLRQKASGMLSDADLLRRLLADSVSTFAVLFRHALALHGLEAPHRKRDVIEAAHRHFGFDAAPFERLLDLREERVKPRDVEPAGLLAGYLEGIGAVIHAVDRLDK